MECDGIEDLKETCPQLYHELAAGLGDNNPWAISIKRVSYFHSNFQCLNLHLFKLICLQFCYLQLLNTIVSMTREFWVGGGGHLRRWFSPNKIKQL